MVNPVTVNGTVFITTNSNIQSHPSKKGHGAELFPVDELLCSGMRVIPSD